MEELKGARPQDENDGVVGGQQSQDRMQTQASPDQVFEPLLDQAPAVDQPDTPLESAGETYNDFAPHPFTRPVGEPEVAEQVTEPVTEQPAAEPAEHQWASAQPWQQYGQADTAFGPQPQTSPSYIGVPVARQPRQKSKPGWTALIAASIVAALVGGGIGIGANDFFNHPGPRPATMRAEESPSGTTQLVDSSVGAADWQAVAKEVGTTVVSLDVTSDTGQSQGSGVIIDDEGHILTNNHVVSGANELFVMFSDGRVFEGDIVGTDEATDLAVVAIKDAPTDLAVARLGSSAALQVGQSVAAIGNPMGLDSTLTTGVISALDRPTQADRGANVVTNAIQIDAAINPGNSGGPVFDQQGRVIGIASSIITVKTSFSGQGGGSIGLGFAIPIDLAKNVAQQLIDTGHAEHAFLGVTISNGLAKFDGTRRTSATVKTVEPGTPADKAGLREGDNIIEVDGRKVSTATALTGYVRQYRSGDAINLKLERDGELLEVDVTLAAREDPR